MSLNDFAAIMKAKKKQQEATEKWCVTIPEADKRGGSPVIILTPKMRRGLFVLENSKTCVYCDVKIGIVDAYYFINDDKYVVHHDCLPSLMFYQGFNMNNYFNIGESSKVPADIQLQIDEYCNFYSFEPCSRCWNSIADSPSYFKMKPCYHNLCVSCLAKTVKIDGYDAHGFIQCSFCHWKAILDE